MQAVIRKAKPEDLPAIQRLGTELMVSERRFDPLFDEQWHFTKDGKEFLLKEIKGQDHVCFLAEVDGQAAGYASCKLLEFDTARPGQRAELDNLVVSEQYRSHGIGHQLIVEFKQWARARGASRLKVIVNAHNKDAIRFYKDNGFQDHQLIMEAVLDQKGEES